MLPWIFIHGYPQMNMSRWRSPYVLQCCHGFSSMDTIYRWNIGHTSLLLQCCHGFSSMDTKLNDFSMGSLISMLQCCHGFSSMDTGCGWVWPWQRPWWASMLPWIFIHGYRFKYCYYSMCLISFCLPFFYIPVYFADQVFREVRI